MLGDSFHSYGLYLSKVGKASEAIDLTGEAIGIRRELASKDTVERAIEWIKVNFVAEGATNILPPLKKVCLIILSFF